MPRFRDTSDLVKVSEDLLDLPSDELDKLARTHWGRAWDSENDTSKNLELATQISTYCTRQYLDMENHAEDVANIAVGDIPIA